MFVSVNGGGYILQVGSEQLQANYHSKLTADRAMILSDSFSLKSHRMDLHASV